MRLLILVLLSLSAKAVVFAPHPKPVQGIQTLVCLGLKYEDVDRHADASDCRRLAHGVDDFYTRNSRNLLKLTTEGFQVDVPFKGANKNLRAAEQFAIARHPGSDLYAIVGMFLSVSHAGSGVAHLRNTLQRDADHEVGHLLGLGHAGAYKREKGKMVLDAYGDGGSVMGRFPSANLTAPQYYAQGWLLDSEAVILEPGSTYVLKRVNDFRGIGFVTVIVPGKTKEERSAFVSFPPGCKNSTSCVALHLGKDGGSQRIKIFGTEYYDEDFTKLHIKKTAFGDDHITVTIDYLKPASRLAEDDQEDDPEEGS